MGKELDTESLEQRIGLCLLVVSEAGYGSFALDADRKISIGRTDECDVKVNDPSVSRRHAELSVSKAGRLEILDLESANGVRILGRRIASNEAAAFNVGEAVMLGSALLIVQDTAAVSNISVLPRPYFEARLAEECRASSRTGRPFTLYDITVSRSPDNEHGGNVASRLRLSDAVGRARPNALFVLMRDVGESQAEDVAQRLRSQLEDSSPIIGFASWPGDGRSPQQLIGAAKSDASGSAPTVFFGAKMKEILDSLDQIAASDLSVLVTGETGVGKEVIAERIHRVSGRSGPFLRLNCAALSHDLIASELFGHVKGSFTGADRDKPGLLEMAEGGTIFLDEIGELHITMQVNLLRVLEERKVRRVGGLEASPIDVRFIAATNRDLVSAVDDGRFRRDLYYRISGSVVELPALRDRDDEIVPLAELFLASFAAQSDDEPLGLADGSKRVLQTYAWPGNIRELRNVMERAAVLCDSDSVEPRHFPLTQMMAQSAVERSEDMFAEDSEATELRPDLNKSSMHTKITRALAKHGGNQGLAAADLGISRRTLMRRMDALGVPRPRKGQS